MCARARRCGDSSVVRAQGRGGRNQRYPSRCAGRQALPSWAWARRWAADARRTEPPLPVTVTPNTRLDRHRTSEYTDSERPWRQMCGFVCVRRRPCRPDMREPTHSRRLLPPRPGQRAPQADGGSSFSVQRSSKQYKVPACLTKPKKKEEKKNVTVPSVVKARRAGTGRNFVLPD